VIPLEHEREENNTYNEIDPEHELSHTPKTRQKESNLTTSRHMPATTPIATPINKDVKHMFDSHDVHQNTCLQESEEDAEELLIND
jgi:hypothetical protein